MRKRRAERELPWHNFFSAGDEDGDRALRNIEDPEPDPETRYAKLEMEATFRGAIRALGSLLGNSVILQCVEEFSVEEAAEILGITVAAERSRMLRARRKLRKRLARQLWGSRAIFQGAARASLSSEKAQRNEQVVGRAEN